MRGAIGTAIVIAAALLMHVSTSSAAWAAEPIAPTFEDVERLADAEKTYAVNAYSIIHVGESQRVNEEGSWWRPDRGLVMRSSVGHDQFFESLGRHDLAEQFASRLIVHRVLVGGGIFVQLGSVFVMAAGIVKNSWLIGGCGVGMLVGGALMRGIGSDMDRPTLSEDRALDMAARYNQALRAHLGLAPLPDAPKTSGSGPFDKTRMTLIPAVGPRHLGLALGVRV
jgi:hypothetical protein